MGVAPQAHYTGGRGAFSRQENGSEKAQRDGALSRLRASANKCKNVGVSPPWDGEMDDSAGHLKEFSGNLTLQSDINSLRPSHFEGLIHPQLHHIRAGLLDIQQYSKPHTPQLVTSWFRLPTCLPSSLAEDAAAPKAEGVDEKFFYGGGYNRFLYGNNRITCGVGYTIPVAYPWINTYGPCSAYALFPGTTRLWFKEAGETASTARRSLAMKADQVFRRDTSTVSCKANNGQTDTFVVSDCLKAVDALVSKKVSSFSCNSCSAKLVSPQGAVVPAAGVPADALQTAAKSMLKACGGQASTRYVDLNSISQVIKRRFVGELRALLMKIAKRVSSRPPSHISEVLIAKWIWKMMCWRIRLSSRNALGLGEQGIFDGDSLFALNGTGKCRQGHIGGGARYFLCEKGCADPYHGEVTDTLASPA
ncbi:hypothetical protein PSTT_02530 [Puccinia striiformis]|uniref:Ig-like domain-containing protein n=1 Tax=Puccinia striiformis TaxID=27350 RepID=A0A2S4VZP3_9BASI|nr:hypothetical protein PSTT_02530 [Puccinia striiformis]